MNPKAIFELFRDAFKDWNEDKAARLGAFLKSFLPGGDFFAQVVNFIINLMVIAAMFALLFKYLPDVKIAWKDVWIGSLVSALLFLIGSSRWRSTWPAAASARPSARRARS